MQVPLESLDSLISAELVYDYTKQVLLPEQLKPRDPTNEKMAAIFATQFQGTEGEKLLETAGRACYDSAGTGRESANFHANLIQVNHGSVWAHFNITLEFNFMAGLRNEGWSRLYALACINRPGVHVRIGAKHALYVTANVRSIREWLDYAVADDTDLVLDTIATVVGFHFNKAVAHLAPAMLNPDSIYHDRWNQIDRAMQDDPRQLSVDGHLADAEPRSVIVPPQTDEEKWISLFVSGSRGLTHELVRHGFRTAISQRSTRFVDEDNSPWVEHPLITAFNAMPVGEERSAYFNARTLGPMTCISQMQGLYKQTVVELEKWLLSKGVDKKSARKQARGAARGYLGNALYTEVIFSGSVAQWKRILRQRGNAHADMEIMTLAARALPEFMKSQYSDRFAAFELQDSPLLIGKIVVETKPDTSRRG